MLQKYAQQFVTENTANPAEIGTALLLSSQEYGIQKELDEVLHLVDRQNFLLFIPHISKEFSKGLIENGHNLILRCGFDFWTTQEFYEKSLSTIDGFAEDFSALSNQAILCCIASSFIQPDRLPLMLEGYAYDMQIQ